MPKFYLCEACKNIAGLVTERAGTLSCCNTPMKYLEPGVVEASREKHLPEVTKTASGLTVKVGSVPHPMEDAHYIDFVYVQTENGGQIAKLSPGQNPEVSFVLNEDAKAVYEYCNLHGLWKTEV